MDKGMDTIPYDQAPTLAAAFRERIKRTPDKVAYRQFNDATNQWDDTTWGAMGQHVARWQAALQKEELNPGDRVALLVRNCKEWVIFDQAALGVGLVVVPLYINDRPENIGYILQNAGVRLLLIENNTQWNELTEIHDQLAGLHRILSLKPVDNTLLQPHLKWVDEWLPTGVCELQPLECKADKLATIVYTSGTTGRSKGVMLSHTNIMWNVHAALKCYAIYSDDSFLSFLPLSHTLERTLGYYLPIVAGSSVAYARSIPELGEDLLHIKPTLLISVPRIFERVYGKISTQLENGPPVARKLFTLAATIGWKNFEYGQKHSTWSLDLLLWPLLDKLVASKVRAKLGGRIRFAVSGGAALSPKVAKLFLGLGIPLQQGYGLTETSPVISGNRLDDNILGSIGVPLHGIEVKIGDNDELLSRSPSVMLGYWDDTEATEKILDPDGWLHTGDKARIDKAGHIFITGRLKEIIVLATGEKVPPADMEMAIALDTLFEQVMVIGEGQPALGALVYLEKEQFMSLLNELGLNPNDKGILKNKSLLSALLGRIQKQMHSFPGYTQIHHVGIVSAPWTVENGLITPTLKIRRSVILEKHAELVDSLYLENQ